ncbi:hypothetical protein [Silvimonas sp.]|uniref:hypothetical protein n=1 Tax=Silvimonas sp. TaxID=2650811 RepID=UPI00284C5E25|nr:hypothetical protein [Silvimonas sp.]MDR3425819.1 hypothetical protein [Silvimonas sp.]
MAGIDRKMRLADIGLGIAQFATSSIVYNIPQTAIRSKPMAIKTRETKRSLQKCSHLLAVLITMAVWPVNAQAQADFPHAEVKWSGGAGMVEFYTNGDTAELTLLSPDGKRSQLRPVYSVDDALAILADERLAFAWPALLSWAGDDLHILRDNVLARAERAADREVQPLPVEGRAKMEGWSKHVRAFQQYISALEHSGRASDAIAKAQTEIAASTPDDNPIVTSQRQIMLAHLLFRDGSTDKAITVLEQASRNAKSNAARQNVNANFALILAITGQYDQALKIDDATERDFDKSASGFLVGHRKLPDSNAYFTGIRACALSGLGKQDQARAALATISGDAAINSYQLSVPAQSRLLAFSCMHDAAGLADELAAQLQAAPPAGQIFLEIQPARETTPTMRDTLIAAVSTDTAIKAMSGRARVLGGTLLPALRSWRDKPAAPSQ